MPFNAWAWVEAISYRAQHAFPAKDLHLIMFDIWDVVIDFFFFLNGTVKSQTKFELGLCESHFSLSNWPESMLTGCLAQLKNNSITFDASSGLHYWQGKTLCWHVNSFFCLSLCPDLFSFSELHFCMLFLADAFWATNRSQTLKRNCNPSQNMSLETSRRAQNANVYSRMLFYDTLLTLFWSEKTSLLSND